MPTSEPFWFCHCSAQKYTNRRVVGMDFMAAHDMTLKGVE
jgi:hypothetical protein